MCQVDPIQLIDLRPTTNKGIEPLPVANVSAFVNNVQVGLRGGCQCCVTCAIHMHVCCASELGRGCTTLSTSSTRSLQTAICHVEWPAA
jgi:hypothetical protein